jgi:hypothetical protein
MGVIHLHKRVAIGRRLLGGLDCNKAIAAGSIFDHDLLTPMAREFLANDAKNGIGSAPSPKGCDDTNGFRWELLCGGARRVERYPESGASHDNTQCPHHAFLRPIFSSSARVDAANL